MMALRKDSNNNYMTIDNLSEQEANDTLLQLVFKDGKMYNKQSFSQIRKRVNS